ncbi:MAG: Hg(II)-responsive transcriptional regulator [Thermicanus sp.]|nr:Hg(II)-responsive transcriptional regulator [Thermicanus sp.]
MKYHSGEIAKICKINKETLRYYERIGLIPEPNRTGAGYRLYSEDVVDRLKLIRRMQEMGFSLSEIDKLLRIVDNGPIRCGDMYDFVARKLEDVRSRIRDLQRIEGILTDLKDRCPDERSVYECPMIETLLEK